ncbi:MAG: Sll0314/Alr1548 family TPR repeat-containing protein [Pseudanabaenaceae cyanobacterium]
MINWKPWAIALLMGLGLSAPAVADPFRVSNPRAIGSRTQTAFALMFRQGNHIAAIQEMNAALRTEANEPLLHALQGARFYLAGDFAGMLVYARRVRTTADALLPKDQLRGHLYRAVASLMEAGHLVSTEGIFAAAPRAIALVQQVLTEMDQAKAVDANDPEYNLIKGYMDMLIANVLPLADLEGALASLRRAAPEYLRWRGIALGYRDARRTAEALEAVDRAIALAPDNPELLYLKGQILWQQGGDLTAAQELYRTAAAKADMLVPAIATQLRNECANITGSPCVPTVAPVSTAR